MELEEAYGEIERQRDELSAKYNAEIEKLRAELCTAKSVNEELTEELCNAKNERDAALDLQGNTQVASAAEIARVEEQLAHYVRGREEAVNALWAAEAQNDALQAQIDALQAQNDALQADNDALRVPIVDAWFAQ